MRAEDVQVGEAYELSLGAWPERAVPLSPPAHGRVECCITHPDEGDRVGKVQTRELKGPWADAEQRAARGYAQVLEQRDLASRLTALGIPREHVHYAGRGGTGDFRDVSLDLDRDELRRLIDLAEHWVAACPHCRDEFDSVAVLDGDLLVVCAMCAKAGRPAATAARRAEVDQDSGGSS